MLQIYTVTRFTKESNLNSNTVHTHTSAREWRYTSLLPSLLPSLQIGEVKRRGKDLKMNAKPSALVVKPICRREARRKLFLRTADSKLQIISVALAFRKVCLINWRFSVFAPPSLHSYTQADTFTFVASNFSRNCCTLARSCQRQRLTTRHTSLAMQPKIYDLANNLLLLLFSYCFLQLLFANRNCCCLFPRFLGCDAINLHLLSVSSPERKSACCNGVGGGGVSHNAAKSLKCHCGSGDKEEVTMTASALSS